jgi:hypothetical protein
MAFQFGAINLLLFLLANAQHMILGLMNIEIEGQLTEKEHTSAQWLHLKPRPAILVVGLALVIVALVVLWLSFFGSYTHQAQAVRWALLAFLGYLVFHWAFVLPAKWKRIYRQQKSLGMPYVLEISEEGISGKTEGMQGINPWSDYMRWKEGNGVFLLYWSDALFQVIPIRFFSTDEQVDEFRTLLREKIGK